MPTSLPFDKATTATAAAHEFAPSIRGKTALVTGCSPGGIGQATAQALASAGIGLLIISGRSESKMESVAFEIKSAHQAVTVRILIMDLNSQASVRKAAAEVNSYPEKAIQLLVNNAGAMASSVDEPTRSPDGLELALATNHIGHFLFTNLIISKLRYAATASPGATRIINLSSAAHAMSPFRFSAYNFEDGDKLADTESADWEVLSQWGIAPPTSGYQPMIAYAQSKTANILFTVALRKRLGSKGITSFALNPGIVRSVGAQPIFDKFGEEAVAALFVKDLDQGASTTVVAACDPGLSGSMDVGEAYLDDCQFAEAKGWAVDADAAERLWGLSEKLVGEEFVL